MKFYKMFRVELLRLFEAKKICFTLIVSLFILFISLTGYFRDFSIQSADVYQILSTLFGGGYYIELLLLPIGYFIVMELHQDVKDKFAFFLTARACKLSYALAKYIAGFVYAFFMFEAVYNLTLLVGMITLPDFHANYYALGQEQYEDLLFKIPFLYFELRILYVSLVMSFYICLGMLMTILFQNEYVAALSPFLARILVEKLQLVSYAFSEHTYFPFIVEGAVRTSSSLVKSIAYIVLFHVSCLIVVWLPYYILLKRRCYGK